MPSESSPKRIQSEEAVKMLNRSSSFIQNLPVAEAEPEMSRQSAVVQSTMEVENITQSGRVHEVFADDDNDDDDDGASLLKKKVPRASLISVRMCKPSPDLVVGLGFRSMAGELQLSKISPTGALSESPLRPGDRLISLDHNSNTAHWTAHQAANYVRHKVGLLSIVVRTKDGDPNRVEATVYKSSIDEKVGISFKKDDGLLQIRYINTKALLGDMSMLKVGDYVESINTMNVSTLDPMLATDIIKGALGKVTIRAKHTDATELSVRNVDLDAAYNTSRRLSSERFLTTADEVGDMTVAAQPREAGVELKPGFISVKITKASRDMRLGISFSNTTETRLSISSVLENSILYSSPLRPGCVVHSLNNIRCRNWSKREALDFVKQKVGDVLIMSQDPEGDPSYASVMAYKESARASIGLSFKSSGGPLRVGNVSPDGIFGDSILNTDDSVISINGIPCQHMRPGDAVDIIKQAAESVCILVKPYRLNGLVLSHASRTPGGDEYVKANRSRR